MANDEADAFDQTEKDLKFLIEKAHSENAALGKILKKISGEDVQEDESEPVVKKKKASKKSNNY
ncbi:MAG: hypothetical protein KUL83_02715 [Lentimicrobium sp.]|jgi:hypothetical protein|nr:hypothetical protein [Lentimicrobium sp.]MDD2529288.1 hypothetical protein [Lentimicrobiaceae bacterium]MDD4599021.1 hypothetical protein [Lentimicrobiaceae bacterium]